MSLKSKNALGVVMVLIAIVVLLVTSFTDYVDKGVFTLLYFGALIIGIVSLMSASIQRDKESLKAWKESLKAWKERNGFIDEEAD